MLCASICGSAATDSRRPSQRRAARPPAAHGPRSRQPQRDHAGARRPIGHGPRPGALTRRVTALTQQLDTFRGRGFQPDAYLNVRRRLVDHAKSSELWRLRRRRHGQPSRRCGCSALPRRAGGDRDRGRRCVAVRFAPCDHADPVQPSRRAVGSHGPARPRAAYDVRLQAAKRRFSGLDAFVSALALSLSHRAVFQTLFQSCPRPPRRIQTPGVCDSS